jgi:hypothetical protein
VTAMRAVIEQLRKRVEQLDAMLGASEEHTQYYEAEAERLGSDNATLRRLVYGIAEHAPVCPDCDGEGELRGNRSNDGDPRAECTCGFEGPDRFGNFDLLEDDKCPIHGAEPVESVDYKSAPRRANVRGHGNQEQES